MNIPALRKLDAMLTVRNMVPMVFMFSSFFDLFDIILTCTFECALFLQDCLDNFKEQNEFYYVSKDGEDKGKNRKDDKWWIPTPKVPPNGLSDVTRKWLQYQKESVNQVLKAAMAINAQVLMEMEIPEDYIESLPKVLIKSM